ncbi:MAG: leucine--tRNA ligase [Rickettsiales bacterium]|jgi:leucyl-tRNA synthetase|nr:leucine--tRNA ligase [Rickettsiales bacterium]
MSDDKIKIREEKWQKKWREARAFVPKNDNKKPKFYNLFEFPFPSGNGLHVGHLVPYVSMDVMARWRRMIGFDVLYPMGLDSMGIAAEHYAKKIGKHPADSVRELIEIFWNDANKIGLSFDPESLLTTSDPKFIKWTQWIFIQLFNAGLAYKDDFPMNWCPNCQTTFTNEELENDACPRCKGPIEQRMKKQWMMAITKYADRLIDDLELVDYPERVRTAQINWVGRSYGADVDFQVGNDTMTVYTTRVDTIFGATFCVIAPEHKLVEKWLADGRIENASDVSDYIAVSAAKSEFERTDAGKEKTGVQLKGLMAINPFTGGEIPIFISDYVLSNYAHGTIMAVPAHDTRDWDFAKKFGLPIIPVLAGGDVESEAWEYDGAHINSGFMDGMDKEEAINAAIDFGAEHGFARRTKKYKMHDWAFSRQMYWGEPIPLVHCEKCGWVPVPDDQLPLLQPHLTDYTPTSDGEGPLARATDWVNTTCPKCGGHATRETDTMPGWAGSSWYFLRYLDVNNDKEFCSRAQMDKWMPIDHYNGPMEHVTRHMMYSRFWYKALHDLGLVPGVEPYKKRTINGLMMGSDGRKMSKSLGNLVPSSDAVNRAGADSVRMTILFLGPFGANINWSEDTLTGVARFLKRVESLSDNLNDNALDADAEFLVNDLIAKMTYRIENMQFNTAISAMMEYINDFGNEMPRRAYEILLQVLNPFAPHLTEEMWERLGHADMLVFEPWPVADESKLARATQTLAVSVNGKRRAEITVAADASESDIVAVARESDAAKFITEIIKTIVIPGRMINFVVK